MKFKMFSVVVGSPACIANCPFCVSRETPNKDNLKDYEINFRNLKIAANLANRSNVDTVMLTSRGEPLLFPDQISNYLKELKEFNFPFIELQTNGILLQKEQEKYDKYLKEWYKNGLTTITISVVSHKKEINQKNYLGNKSDYIDLPKLIDYLHELKFCVRITCVCCKDMMDNSKEVKELIKFAKDNKVEQVTLRPVNDEYRRESTRLWILDNKLTDENKKDIKDYLEKEGTKLLELERIGTVYDVDGQNVLYSLPLTKYTRDTNPENLRNLIFFPDGHIRYEWEMEGGILL
ncbi:MAG: radical SAM protein [Bacilli bacterium]|nr:radical SAM protein [Bacilli bacterium]